MQKVVFIPQPIDQRAVKMLLERSKVLLGYGGESVEWGDGISEAHGVIIRTAPFTEADFRHATKLRVIGRHGVGLDNIDLGAATQRKVAVLNTPWANVESVAEQALACMLSLAARLFESDAAVRSGTFYKRDDLVGVELASKTLGVIGFGKIGHAVASKCRRALDMKVVFYDPHNPLQGAEDLAFERLDSLAAVLSRADVVTLHLPLTAETRHLIGPRELAVMKPGSFLLNLARGGIVNEEALCEALENGPLRGAAVDVFEQEPPPADHPLFSLPNAIVTPHNAAHTHEAFERMAVQAAQAVMRYLEDGTAENIVNPQILSSVGQSGYPAA